MDYAEKAFKLTEAVACPACGSLNCQLHTTAQKAGVVVGGTLGAVIAAGFTGAKIGAISGVAVSNLVGQKSPADVMSTISCAMIGFAWGATAGYIVGNDIDKTILRFYQCPDCRFEFKA